MCSKIPKNRQRLHYARVVLILSVLALPSFGFCQKSESNQAPPEAPQRVEIKPTIRDEEIQERLESILNATGWFISPQVEVREGVVFLSGKTKTEEFKKWAGHLARNAQDVAAVVNKIEVAPPPFWDFSTVGSSLKKQLKEFLSSVPSILAGLVILCLALLLARLSVSISRVSLKKRMRGSLLSEVIARGIGVVIFLLGVYVIFEMADLTSAAFTVIGGTGLLGIILGIAFRDITENFLASILLSIQNPFRSGDIIEVAGVIGYVQSLNMRVTLLMSFEGSHIQIPNATIYKSQIRNYSSNSNRREEFSIGIGFIDTISKAQEVALKVLDDHEAVLKDPEPMVLVNEIGKSCIVLKVYFWMNGKEHSWLKVRSSVIRLVKRAFQEENISMPDEARERVFPQDLTVHLAEKAIHQKETSKATSHKESKSTATAAESDLKSDAKEIKEQAQKARVPEKGKNLLS